MKDSLLGVYSKEKRKTILHKKVGRCPRTRAGGPGFDLVGVTHTVGAPSLRSLQGRESEMPAQHGPITGSARDSVPESKEAVAATRRPQKRQSPVTRASDKVQVMNAVSALQPAGPVQPHPTGSIVPALAKNARTGHPRSRYGKGKTWKAGPPACSMSLRFNFLRFCP
jgi:hypothetical protein